MDKNREADREGKKAKRTRATSARMLGYLQQQRGTLISLTLLVLTGSVLTLLAPYLLGLAVDEYILLHNVNGMIRVCILLLIIYVTASLVSWLQNHLMAAVSSRVVWKLREELFGRLSRLPLRFFDRSKHGDLMSRTTNDMENISNTLNQTLLQAITSTIMLIGSFGMMLYLNIWLTLVAMVTIPVVLFVIRRIVKQTKFHFAQQQKRLGTLNGYMEEMITGQKAVKLYHREQRESEQFAVQNEELTRAGIRAQILSGFVGPTMNMTNHLNFMLIAVAGAWMAVNEWVTVGIVVSFLNYSRQFSGPLNQLANQYNMIQSGIAGAERVFEIIDTPTEFDEETPLRQADFKHGRVDFDKVDFAYDVNPILRQVSFTAEPGQTIALVGPTGAGKTTIINMLTRFYEISGGSIRIDGTDIRSYDKESLRSRLGIVLQDAHLFSGTVLDNIRYGRLKATEEEVMAAAKLANADAMIRKLPQGYQTKLSAEGGNLSQGQRQLVTIARAILADPAILILDEATSSVDTRTEMQIQEGLRVLMKGRTSFVIAHRLNTIRSADRILVIRDGEVTEQGTHEELLALKGFYYGSHMLLAK